MSDESIDWGKMKPFPEGHVGIEGVDAEEVASFLDAIDRGENRSEFDDTGENVIERAEREQAEAWAELEALRAENERLRAQVKLAHAILSSEQLAWLFVGSNHPEAQWAGIKPAIRAYWEQYGNYFRPKGDGYV